jgi:ABC-type multidrug transport system ATPase subunit
MLHLAPICCLLLQCEQADIHSPLATVREALAFSASLRLKTQTGASSPSRAVAVAAAVDEVLQLVDLEHLAGRLVGTPGKSR